MTTAKSEKSRNSSGLLVICRSISVWLKAPFRPRNGIQAIVRMMPDVQNGIAQSRNRTVRTVAVRTWNTRKYAILKPRKSVISHTIRPSRSELI